MTFAVCVLGALWLAYLLWEKARLNAARKKIKHIVHVNGIRGKSSVSRLTDAALRAGGFKVLTKTTGTDPVILGTDGKPRPVKRFGCANVREQARTLLLAAKEGADVLVIECMAVQPELQRACQHGILQADVTVITNVRRDHADVMGETPDEIAASLSSTVPENGTLFTAEHTHTAPIKKACRKNGSRFCEVFPAGDEGDADFPENTALALAVAEHLSVPRKKALEGIKTLYQRDPYVLSVHSWGKTVFVNAFSVNDPASLLIVKDYTEQKYALGGRDFVLLINNRVDRGSRAEDMTDFAAACRPKEVLLLGAFQGYTRARLKKLLPGVKITSLDRAEALDPAAFKENTVLFAAGNIAGEGRRVMARVREEGGELVQ